MLALLPGSTLLVHPDLYERDHGKLAVALYSREVKMSAELREGVFELPFCASNGLGPSGSGISVNPHLLDWTFKYGESLRNKLQREFYFPSHEDHTDSELSSDRPYECFPLSMG